MESEVYAELHFLKHELDIKHSTFTRLYSNTIGKATYDSGQGQLDESLKELKQAVEALNDFVQKLET